MLSCAGENRKKKIFQNFEKIYQNIENTLKISQGVQFSSVPEFITIIDEFGAETIVFYEWKIIFHFVPLFFSRIISPFSWSVEVLIIFNPIVDGFV